VINIKIKEVYFHLISFLIILTIFLPFVSAYSADVKPPIFYFGYDAILLYMLLIFLNLPLNLLLISLSLTILKTINIQMNSISKNSFKMLILIVIICSLLGAFFHLFTLFDSKMHFSFEFFYWFGGSIFIIVSFYVSLILLSRNLLLSTITSIFIGLINILIWCLILLSMKKDFSIELAAIFIIFSAISYCISPFLLRKYFHTLFLEKSKKVSF